MSKQVAITAGLLGALTLKAARDGVFGVGKCICTDEKTLEYSVTNYGLCSRVQIWTDREPFRDQNHMIVPLTPVVEYRVRPFFVYNKVTETYQNY